MKCQALFFSPTTAAAQQIGEIGENVSEEPPAVWKRDRHHMACTLPTMSDKGSPELTVEVGTTHPKVPKFVEKCIKINFALKTPRKKGEKRYI